MNNNDKRRNGFFCGNCGRTGHFYKNCPEPIISLGIILIKINIDNIITNSTINEFNIKAANLSGVFYGKNENINYFSLFKDNVNFLLIRRKYSLGYMEFLRGRYKYDNIDGISFLFQQMTKEEIKKIESNDFDKLWDELWLHDDKNTIYDNEYRQSKEKFNKLKSKNGMEHYYGLEFYVKHIKPIWDEPEWGFPKGRRKLHESDISCAVREFEEETGFGKKDYVMLNNINPFIENLIGTNGTRYMHKYYLGLSISNKSPELDVTNKSQMGEIGKIGYYTHDGSLKMIRSYHLERKKILTMVYMFALNKLMGIYIEKYSNSDTTSKKNKHNKNKLFKIKNEKSPEKTTNIKLDNTLDDTLNDTITDKDKNKIKTAP